MKYYVMNKNTIVAKFDVFNTQYGTHYQYIDIDIQELPFKLINLDEFIKSRTVLTDRYGLKDNLAKIGIKEHIDLLKLTYGVSLVDTFWIKEESDSMTWEHISPYRADRQFNLSWLFTDSMRPELYRGVPDYSTDGNFPKCWVTANNEKHLIKCGTSGAYNAGLEPLSDILFTQIADCIAFNNYVHYARTDIDIQRLSKEYRTPGLLKDTVRITEGKRFSSICKSFTSEDYGLVTAYELGLKSFEDIIDFARKHCENWKDACCIYLCDAIGFNEDRHNGNIGFLFDTNTYQILSVAPMYDNNLSLLCYYDDRVDLDDYLEQLKAKDGRNFVDLAHKVLEYIPEREDLLRQILNNFSFSSDFYVAEKRIALLNEVVNQQIRKILFG